MLQNQGSPLFQPAGMREVSAAVSSVQSLGRVSMEPLREGKESQSKM